MTTINTAIFTQEKFLAEIRKLSLNLFSLAFPGAAIGCTESQWREYKQTEWPCAEYCRNRYCGGDWNAMLASLGLSPATQSQSKTAANARAKAGLSAFTRERALERQRMAEMLDAPVEELPSVIEDDWGLAVVGAPKVIERDVIVRMKGHKVVVGKRVETRYMLR